MNVPFTVTRLCSGFSLEVTPREAMRIERFADDLPPGTSVYVTYLANAPFSETVEAVRRLAVENMKPVPHLAARAVRDVRHLDEKLAELTGEGGVDEVLLIGGSLARPVGEFDATIQILRTGCLERRGIRRVALAGHPEGSPDISDEGLRQALKEKNEFAAETAMQLYLVTQFCFAAEPVVTWERQIRAEGNRLPIHVGLPGLASPAKLLRFGLSCGVGPSLKVLRKQAGNVLKMATTSSYRPDATILGIAEAATTDRHALFRGLHFFPFGSYRRTAAWAKAIGDGQFILDQPADRLEVAE
jgi:methylenetetrahydrofolate reductase (NADPH)